MVLVHIEEEGEDEAGHVGAGEPERAHWEAVDFDVLALVLCWPPAIDAARATCACASWRHLGLRFLALRASWAGCGPPPAGKDDLPSGAAPGAAAGGRGARRALEAEGRALLRPAAPPPARAAGAYPSRSPSAPRGAERPRSQGRTARAGASPGPGRPRGGWTWRTVHAAEGRLLFEDSAASGPAAFRRWVRLGAPAAPGAPDEGGRLSAAAAPGRPGADGAPEVAAALWHELPAGSAPRRVRVRARLGPAGSCPFGSAELFVLLPGNAAGPSPRWLQEGAAGRGFRLGAAGLAAGLFASWGPGGVCMRRGRRVCGLLGRMATPPGVEEAAPADWMDLELRLQGWGQEGGAAAADAAALGASSPSRARGHASAGAEEAGRPIGDDGGRAPRAGPRCELRLGGGGVAGRGQAPMPAAPGTGAEGGGAPPPPPRDLGVAGVLLAVGPGTTAEFAQVEVL